MIKARCKSLTSHAGAVAMVVLIAAAAGPAAAQMELEGRELGTTIGQIAGRLEAMGYFVTEAELEDGMIEVEILVDGVEYELEVDPETGLVTQIEEDD